MSKSHVPTQEKRIDSPKETPQGILPYDTDNLYPQNMDRLVKASGMATSCVNLLAKFIQGKGYKDNTFYKTKVNKKGLTLDKLSRATAKDIARYAGSSWLVKYNGLLQIDEVYHVPFDWCRLAKLDDNGYVTKIAVYDDWACVKRAKIENDKIEYYDVYNPGADAIIGQIEAAKGMEFYQGQIYWSSESGLMEYPLASYDSVREDMATDSALKEFRMNNVYTGFAPALAAEYGYAFEDDDQRDNEAANWKTFKGPKNPNKIIMIEHKNGNKDGNALKLTPIQGNNNDKMYELTSKTVRYSIIEAFSQPKELLGVQSDGGVTFSNDVLRDAFEYYNAVTSDPRLELEEKTKEIFSRYKDPINSTGDYSIIPLSFGTTPTPAVN